MRDQDWLEIRFNQIWDLFFKEVERKEVSIIWKGKWKNKFGHITRKNEKTEIAINKFFQDLRVPEDIIKLTIAHEIVHYMHGFHSHLPKQYKHPHAGGVVNRELKNRGFDYALKYEKEWVKDEWFKLYNELNGNKLKRRKRISLLDFFRL